MNVKKLFKTVVSSALICLCFFVTLSANAQSKGIWKGPSMTFTKADLADWTQADNQDRLSDSVWLTRQDTKSIFNIKANSSYKSGSPKGTFWSFGTTADIATLTFEDWITAVNNKPNSAVNKDMVLFLTHDSIYIDIKFTSFSGGGPGGGFAYVRSTDCRTYESVTMSACNSYTSPSGAVWTSSGKFQDTISNDQGCDSIITFDLTIKSLNLDVITRRDTLTAQEVGATFQWLECPSFTIIPGETSSRIITKKSDEYAVEISKDGCVDTSICYTTKYENVIPLNHALVSLYPNPTTGFVNVDFGPIQSYVLIEQFDLLGHLISSSNYRHQSKVQFHLEGDAGQYVLVFTDSLKNSHTVMIFKK